MKLKPKSKKISHCGLDIGPHFIRLAELDHSGQHAVVKNINEIESVTPIFNQARVTNKDHLADLIYRLFLTAQPEAIRTTSVVATLPHHLIHHHRITLPNLPPAELNEEIEKQMKEIFSGNTDNWYIDYTPIAWDPHRQQIEVSLFATAKPAVDDVIATLSYCQLDLIAIESKPTALNRAVLTDKDRGVVFILEVDQSLSHLVINERGAIWQSECYQLGTMHFNRPDGEQALTYLIERCEDIGHRFRKFSPSPIERILVLSDRSFLNRIIQKMSTIFPHSQCEAGVPLVHSSGGSALNNLGSKYSSAFGLAMR